MLAEAGLRYFVADAHGLLFATPRPRHGTCRADLLPGSGVAAFGRDIESSVQVWSRDAATPATSPTGSSTATSATTSSWTTSGPTCSPTARRKDTGIKYHRITGPTDHKELYDPYWARERAAEHAANFMFNRERQIEHLPADGPGAPIVVSPYDAELFGHWWYEGPWWLELRAPQVGLSTSSAFR